MTRGELRRQERRKERDVIIGYVHPDDVAGLFCDNLADLCLWDGGPKGRKRILVRTSVAGGPRISETRNMVMQEFLKSGARWLWFLDADMSFHHELMYDLLDVAETAPEEPKVLGALAFAGGRTPFLKPVIYSEPTEGVFQLVDTYPEDALCKVAATGCACLLIHRSVAEDVYRKHQEKAHPWFQDGVQGKAEYGEDITFCRRARAAGHDIYVHTGIEVGHMKMMALHSGLYKVLNNLLPTERAEYEEAHRRAMGGPRAS